MFDFDPLIPGSQVSLESSPLEALSSQFGFLTLLRIDLRVIGGSDDVAEAVAPLFLPPDDAIEVDVLPDADFMSPMM